MINNTFTAQNGNKIALPMVESDWQSALEVKSEIGLCLKNRVACGWGTMNSATGGFKKETRGFLSVKTELVQDVDAVAAIFCNEGRYHFAAISEEKLRLNGSLFFIRDVTKLIGHLSHKDIERILYTEPENNDWS